MKASFLLLFALCTIISSQYARESYGYEYERRDVVYERVQTGFLDEFLGSLGGTVMGAILLVVAAILLFWNEGRAVRCAKALKAARGKVSPMTEKSKDGDLIHCMGMTSVTGQVSDPQFGIPAPNALRFKRRVETYQWKETKTKVSSEKQLGGGKDTLYKYTYSSCWSDHHIDSRNFHEELHHENPDKMIAMTQEFDAKTVLLCNKQMSTSQIRQIVKWEPFPVDAKLMGGHQITPNICFFGSNPNEPKVGDTRFTFEVVRPCQVSILSTFSSNQFTPWLDPGTKKSIDLLQVGSVAAESMLASAEANIAFVTWIFRLLGIFLNFIGLMSLFAPMQVIMDILPFLGTIFGWGVNVACGVLGFVWSLLIIAVAWFTYRPVLTVTLVGIAAIITYGPTLYLENIDSMEKS